MSLSEPDTIESPTTLGAAELTRRIAAGAVSATELVEAHIAHVEQVNGRLNAVVQPTFDQAREEALRADQALADGRSVGALHGVPVTVKDCFALSGTTATLGIPGHGATAGGERKMFGFTM